MEARGSHRRGSNQRFAVEMEFGFSGWQPLDFDIYPLHAGRPACSQRFESGFLGSKTRGVVNGRVRAFPAVLSLAFCIYSTKEPVAEALDGLAYSLVLNDVDADAGDHTLLCYR